MRLLFATCFSVNLLVLVAMNGTESDICEETNVCSAIKALESKREAKLENLFKLVYP